MTSKFILFFLHPELQNSNNTLRSKVIIFTKIVLSIPIINSIYFVIYLFNKPDFWMILPFFNIIFGPIITLFFLRFQPNFKLTFFILFCFIIPVEIWYVVLGGGIYSTSLIWFLVFCITVFYFVGRKEGVYFSIFCILIYLILLIITYDPKLNAIYLLFLKNQKPEESFFNIFSAHIFSYIFLNLFVKSIDEANFQIKSDNEKKATILQEKITKKTTENMELRLNLARDFHDEMGNKLIGINLLSQILSDKLENNSNPEIEEILKTIQIRSDELFEGTKDFIWSIDFKSDYLPNMITYITDFGEDFFSKIDIDFQCKTVLKNTNNQILKTQNGRQMVIVAKELMTNIAKHAKAKNVIFEAYIQNENLILILKDNGVGFDFKKVRKNGILNIIERIKILQGTIEYLSSNTIGTEIKIAIPYEIEV